MTDTTRPAIPTAIREGRAIAILRGVDPQITGPIVDALVEGGITAVEVTLNSKDPFATIAELRRRTDGTSLLIGAGTVMDRESAEASVAAGAAFLVAPNTDPDLVRWAAAQGVPMFPGAMTPSEIVTAWNAGAAAVKVFPASVLGPTFLREVRGPLPQVPLIPTGGVNADTARPLLDAGAVAIGIGSWLTGSTDPAEVLGRARQLRSAIDRQ
jgi:2-dehydro-3-deoxyphosphogluconate aldolase/(4S)-4-hydroxy-2-oxoglutarate aldolase